MARACVIVLDAVGAGELPDAGDFGDQGSDTLGNVARAVGGLDLPNLEALGLGNVEELQGCPPQAASRPQPAVHPLPGATRGYFGPCHARNHAPGRPCVRATFGTSTA